MPVTYSPIHGTPLDPNGQHCADCLIERLYGITLRAIQSLRRYAL